LSSNQLLDHPVGHATRSGLAQISGPDFSEVVSEKQIPPRVFPLCGTAPRAGIVLQKQPRRHAVIARHALMSSMANQPRLAVSAAKRAVLCNLMQQTSW